MLKCTCDEEKPYIFISYAHRDSAKVINIIRRLMKDGYNVWYDEGIDPGTVYEMSVLRSDIDAGYRKMYQLRKAAKQGQKFLLLLREETYCCFTELLYFLQQIHA